MPEKLIVYEVIVVFTTWSLPLLICLEESIEKWYTGWGDDSSPNRHIWCSKFIQKLKSLIVDIDYSKVQKDGSFDGEKFRQGNAWAKMCIF